MRLLLVETEGKFDTQVGLAVVLSAFHCYSIDPLRGVYTPHLLGLRVRCDYLAHSAGAKGWCIHLEPRSRGCDDMA